MDDERMRILKRIEAGEISAEEAVRLLSELSQQPAPEAEPEVVQPEPDVPPAAPAESMPPVEVPKGFSHFWLYPLWAGEGTLVLGAILLYAVYGAQAGWGWAVCGWPLFALGVLVTVAAWWVRTARWVHVRVRGKENVSISLPLPIKLTAWVIKIVKPFVPQFKDTGVDEAILGLADALKEGNEPLYVDVNDDDSGEHVQVYIG
jgi:hypothetical protein